MYKKCGRCKRELPVDSAHFRKESRKKDGFQTICKECMGSKFGVKIKMVKERKRKPVTREGFRICSKCLIELPATSEYFNKQKEVKDGCTSKCKICLGTKNYGVTMPNMVYQTREGHKICTSCRLELPFEKFNVCKPNKDGYYSKCKRCYNEYCKIVRNKPDLKEKKSVYGKEYRKKYYATEQGKRVNAINCQRRKHRKKQAFQNYNISIWNETLEYFDHRCVYCGTSGDLQQEHVIPLNKGGSYIKQNIVPACQFCNGSKHDYDLEEWYKKQPFFNNDRLVKIYKWIGFNQKKKIQQLSIF